ncbi:unnamed protein product [Paramecium sonneborni]|uniref:Uncharacterized protein n=1 Tax=Paramecium sonneborni TaxID=65129 RepID=A0A8S1QNU7_9CILI|nr:unnamed protein product [Paramecium sonneborni]
MNLQFDWLIQKIVNYKQKMEYYKYIKKNDFQQIFKQSFKFYYINKLIRNNCIKKVKNLYTLNELPYKIQKFYINSKQVQIAIKEKKIKNKIKQ